MKKLTTFLFFVLIFIASAQATSYVFEAEEEIDLRASCFDIDETPCDATTTCHLTVFRPNSDLLLDNVTMTRGGTYYNYSINSTQNSVLGEHSAVVYCDGGTDAYASFTYKVTPNGEEITEGSSTLYIGLFILLVLLFGLGIYGIFNTKNTTGKYTYVGFSYLLMIAVVYVAWGIADNFLTASIGISEFLFMVFRILMAMALPFFLGSFIFYFMEMRNIKQIKDMIEKGVPEDEAVLRRGKKW